MGAAGTADEFALGQVEDDVSGLAMARETCPVVASSVVAESDLAESDLAESGLAGRGVVSDVEGHLLAPWSGGAGADGVSVGFLVEVEEVVAEVFFEDAHGCLATQGRLDPPLPGFLLGGLLLGGGVAGGFGGARCWGGW